MATIDEKRIAAKRKLAKQKLAQGSQPAQPEGVDPVDSQETSILQDLDAGLRKIPGAPQLAEIASGFNRTVVDFADFLVPDTVNAILSLSGSDKRVPTLKENIQGIEGGFVPEGLQRDVLSATGETGAMALGVGTALRGLAAKLPAQFAGESVKAGALRQLASSTPKADAILGGASGAGSEIGEDAAGEAGALVGGIIAPVAVSGIPASTSAIVKNIFRGNEQGRQAVKKSIEAFNVSGSTPTLGQATGRPSLQAIESTSGKSPGGRPLRVQLDKTSDNIQRTLKNIADSVSTTKGEEAAGRAIQRGISGNDGFVSRFQNKSGLLWNKLDELMPKNKKVGIDNTRNTINRLVRGDEFGEILNNPQVVKIGKVLDDADGVVDYGTLTEIRQVIGRRLGSNDLVSDIPRAELKQLYGSLTDDLKSAAAGQSNEALKAFVRANKFTKAGHGRLDDFVERIAGKVELDKVFRAVTKGGEGTQTINAFKRSLKPDEWDVVVSNVIRRLGNANAGKQDVSGEVFSVDKFLTDWNKLGTAKNALFSGSKNLTRMKKDLNYLAQTAERVKTASSELAGRSGTAQLAASMGTSGAVGGALLSGNINVAGGLLSLVSANYGAARLMASPRFVNWLATTAKTSNLPSQIVKLGAIASASDPELANDINQFIEDAKRQDTEIQEQQSQ